MSELHQKTTLHCDEVWRKSSIDGLLFDGPEERVLSSASVADVWIEPDGSHLIVYNDLRPKLLLEKALEDPQIFWRMGLVGFGGLGISLDRMDGSQLTSVSTDLHLAHPQEVVDPDISRTGKGNWRLVWFGVNPKDMNPDATGPLNAPKPHNFYRAESADLSDMGTPELILSSSHGTTGGADPTIVSKPNGGEILFIGPLDRTVMAWETDQNDLWNPNAKPTYNTQAPLASPDVILTEEGYRLYGMRNGEPSIFELYTSEKGIRWERHGIVMRNEAAFNVSISRDPIGTWWLYYNKTNANCLKEWGSERVLPKGATTVLPPTIPSFEDNNTPLLPANLMKNTPKNKQLENIKPEKSRK